MFLGSDDLSQAVRAAELEAFFWIGNQALAFHAQQNGSD